MMIKRSQAEIDNYRKRIRIAANAATNRLRRENPNWEADAKATVDQWLNKNNAEPGVIFNRPQDLNGMLEENVR